MKEPASYERAVGTMPADLRESGGFTLDADETVAYLGVGKAAPSGGAEGLRSRLGAASARWTSRPGRWRPSSTCLSRWPYPGEPLRAGRDPVLPETGGDAPQRMWITRSDGTGNRSLYKETRTNG